MLEYNYTSKAPLEATCSNFEWKTENYGDHRVPHRKKENGILEKIVGSTHGKFDGVMRRQWCGKRRIHKERSFASSVSVPW